MRAWGTRLAAASVRAWTLQQRGYRAGQLKAAATVRACRPSPPLSHPPALTTSAGRRAVVSSVPASILTGILTVVVAVARRRRSSPRRREVPTNVSTTVSASISTQVSTSGAGRRVSSVPASILTSPPGPVCGDCGGCRAPARLQRGRSDCEGAWTTATVRACGGCSAGFKKAPGCNNSEGAYTLQWAWGLQRLRLGVSDCGSEAGAWGCSWSCAAATAAARLGLQ